MKTKVIRTVEELENLRVSLSNEIEVLLQTGQDVQTLDKIKALRKALGEIRDELTIAKNIEANKVKESLLIEVRSVEAEANWVFR
jgi:CHAD domain-containing protein